MPLPSTPTQRIIPDATRFRALPGEVVKFKESHYENCDNMDDNALQRVAVRSRPDSF